ncbi:ClpP/crotonase-like domain-containing protein [Cercophora newfieldiana]|uniref:ClpP/crotonase-like domain-containing protein n=1 Tax=Cercophora newfieldiana TaxID=92897 RepID=A0AA39Y4X3_9PEZI|nr:ClpP/crotonase-like domain-containing protein [Cercophora newfieldiana]
MAIIEVEYRGRLAVITINNPAKLNALGMPEYFQLSQSLREIATHPEVFITLIIGNGRYFSAGADVSASRPSSTSPDLSDPSSAEDTSAARQHWLRTFLANNLNTTQSFYSHPKILIVALNGPVVGLSAALTAFADFVYAAPHTFLLTPFSSLGLVAEGGASRALVQRLGISKANEALIMSKRISAEELVSTGYVNKIMEVVKPGEDEKFKEMVLKEIDERLGEHLIGDSLLGIKALIRRPERDVIEQQNASEVLAGVERFMSGVPQEEFAKIASGKKRHKL